MERKSPAVFLAGDSTMSRKEEKVFPEHGWGMMIPEFFKPSVSFINEAKNGRSTKSFIQEGRWDRILAGLQLGDYVLIQFGHNDEKSEDPERYTAPCGEYSRNLEYFINSALEKGAHPVLMTPVCRRKFNADGKLEMTHGDYPGAVKAIAAKWKVPCIDMETKSAALLRSYGPDNSKKLFMHLKPGTYSNYPDGKEDDTHFNIEGARTIAELAAQELTQVVPGLAGYLSDAVSSS